ncbi:MAG: hypothetical protein ACLRI8_03005 [Agathobacter rectalis]
MLVGVSEQDGDDADDSLSELAELVKTAGATVVGTLIQRREKFIRARMSARQGGRDCRACGEYRATGIVCDDELSPHSRKSGDVP